MGDTGEIRKIGGHRFKEVKECKKKTDAKKKAEGIRDKGHLARVIKEKEDGKTRWAVYKGPKA